MSEKMKKLSYYLCLVIVLFSSCQQDEIFSCNEDVNRWANDNIDDIRVMTRSDWNNLDENRKMACYAAFTTEQRISFWKEKFDNVLNLNWNSEEMEHIKLLQNFVESHCDFFDREKQMTDEDYEVVELFAYRWKQKAEEDLGWSDKLIKALIADGNEIVDKNGTTLFIQPNLAVKSRSEISCDCSVSSDWCSHYYECGTRTTCDKKIRECGTLYLFDCDGVCSLM